MGLGLLLVLGSLAGCATTGSEIAQDDPAALAEPRESAPIFQAADPMVSLEEDFSSLRDVLRKIGESYGGNVSVVQGIGLHPTEPRRWQRSPYRKVVEDLALEVQAEIQNNAHYYFLYPPGYEALLSLSLGETLGPWADQPVSCAFGEGTHLYNVCAMLSKSLNRAIVADNIIGETICGEVILSDAPLWAVLEAVLKSARIVPGTFDIDVTDEYIFIYATEPPRPRNFLIGGASLSAAQRQQLDKVVTLELSPGRGSLYQEGAQTLETALTPLSQQFGVTISTEARLRDLPVNPVYMPQIRVETALDLLVRQWPYPSFGYRWAEEGIRLVLR